jgi:cilia- and flagella-associated protein 58
VKALSEELENPINIHRWRKLEGSDPQAHELVLKTQLLQKRLIAKTEEAVEKDLLLQEKHREMEKLQQQLERMPGQDAALQLSMLKSNLKEKTKQLQSLMSQLNLHEIAAANHKRDVEGLQKELQAVQQKYYAIKRRERKREAGDAPGSPQAGKSPGTLPRVGAPAATVGGGFNTRAYGSSAGSSGFANVRPSDNMNERSP